MLKYLGKIWKFITHVRTGLANLIFILLIVFIAVSVANSDKQPLPDKAPLLVRISGKLVDQVTYEPTIFDLFEEEKEDTETLLRDVTTAIKHAAKDNRINGLLLNMNGLSASNFSKLEEIGQAIELFKESKKPVIAYADSYSQQQYFLASYADEIYINPMGNITITGFGYYGSYFKEAADKLSIKFHLFKVGNYKDAAEPFVRNSMSEASREHNSGWITELWQRYTDKVEAHRQLDSGTIETFVNNLKDTLADNKDSFANLAKKTGFVDDVVSRVSLNNKLIERFGKEKDADFFKAITYKRYLQEVKSPFPHNSNNIGLIVASGTIVDGKAPEGRIGGASLAKLIRKAQNDDSLEALIIRVDSGGGSAFASEVIRDELINAKQQGLPIYISMSSVAASGGYWLATAAEEIWALPSTITGSIGVWGLLPNISESMKRVGIHNDGFGTTSLSDLYQISRPLSPEAKQVFQTGVDNVYRQFINLVAEAREQTPEAIHKVAQGRVWTGQKALEFGLVDQLGTLDDLVASVAEKQQLSNYHVKVIRRTLSPSQEFLRAVMEEANTFGQSVRKGIVGEHISELVDTLPLDKIQSALPIDASPLQRIYAECLACMIP